jgi:allantoin racemase
MKRVLVINPNTSANVTAMVLTQCRQAQGQTAWDGVTARLGAPYIASEVAYALAAHAVLDAYATHYAGHDAVLIACFGDPGLLALREICPVPVIGLAEASFFAAAKRGRFAVVTGGRAWGPMLQRFARTHQLDALLVGIYTVDLTGAQIAKAPDTAIADLSSACRAGVDGGAQCIVLGGAALTGLAAALGTLLGAPVLDNVHVGAEAAARAAMTATPQRIDASSLPQLAGLGHELVALLGGIA